MAKFPENRKFQRPSINFVATNDTINVTAMIDKSFINFLPDF